MRATRSSWWLCVLRDLICWGRNSRVTPALSRKLSTQIFKLQLPPISPTSLSLVFGGSSVTVEEKFPTWTATVGGPDKPQERLNYHKEGSASNHVLYLTCPNWYLLGWFCSWGLALLPLGSEWASLNSSAWALSSSVILGLLKPSCLLICRSGLEVLSLDKHWNWVMKKNRLQKPLWGTSPSRGMWTRMARRLGKRVKSDRDHLCGTTGRLRWFMLIPIPYIFHRRYVFSRHRKWQR